MIVEYLTQKNEIIYRTRHHDVQSVNWEPYPPGGRLLVMRNAAGQTIAGPWDGDLIAWATAYDGTACPFLHSPTNT